MKVVCILKEDLSKELTYGKVYDILDNLDKRFEYDCIFVINDKGFKFGYFAYKFLSLNEWREDILNKIL